MRCYSIKEVAKLIGIGVSTFYLWVERGQAPRVMRVGGRVFVVERDYMAWLDAQAAKQP